MELHFYFVVCHKNKQTYLHYGCPGPKRKQMSDGVVRQFEEGGCVVSHQD